MKSSNSKQDKTISLPIRYVAFLRGINVGGNKIIKMADLAQMFSSMGFKNVKTFIQSGNVLFESPKTQANGLPSFIEKGLKSKLGYEVKILVRSIPELIEMVQAKPYKKVNPGEVAHRYVTFLSDKPVKKLACPYFSPKQDFEILTVDNREIYSLSYPALKGRFGNPVTFIEKEFGEYATTRNWNTIEKIIAL